MNWNHWHGGGYAHNDWHQHVHSGGFAEKLSRSHGAFGAGFVGDGECTTLVQGRCHVGATPFWRPGASLAGHPDLASGTPIATFDKSGHYHGHAAIFKRWVPGGALVEDQWNGKHSAGGPHPDQERVMGFNSSGRYNNPNFFSVIESVGQALSGHIRDMGKHIDEGFHAVEREWSGHSMPSARMQADNAEPRITRRR